MRGPKPKDPNLKLVTGNPGKRPIPQAHKGKADAPPPFDWMSDEAKREWERVAQQLANRGLLTVLDLTSLAVYCECVNSYRSAKAIVEKDGETYENRGLVKKHPAVGIRDQAARDVAMWARELGLVPTARQRLGIDDAEEVADPLDAFIG